MTQTTSADDLAYLKACSALGLDPGTREKVGNGSSAGAKVPKKERASNGESLTAVTRRREKERQEKLRQDWIDHYYHEIDAAYNRYIHIKGRNLQCITELQGSGA